MAREATLDIPVRWGDLDAFDHVNNTVFLRFIEEARVQFFSDLDVAWNGKDSGVVVVNINCNFRREIQYPATVRVSTRAYQASEKRLVMEHRLVDAEKPERLYADAEVTALWIDKTQGQGSIPLPKSIVEALAQG